MSLLRQIQGLMERTYGPTGINLEDCVIGPLRCRDWSDEAEDFSKDLGPEGRTFFRVEDGRLRLAVYFDPAVIQTLEEHDPSRELGDVNIRPLIVFLEEIDHAIHGILRFLEDRFDAGETMLCDLELQARVDTHQALLLLAMRIQKTTKLSQRQRHWIGRSLFGRETFRFKSPVLVRRYREANGWGRRLARCLERIPADVRIGYLRSFRTLSLTDKHHSIQHLERTVSV